MRKNLTPFLLSLLAVMASLVGNSISAVALPQPAPSHKGPLAVASVDIPIPDIRYTKFVLSNGLTVLVHGDHKAPIVAASP